MAIPGADEKRFINEAFWILLGRAPAPTEFRDEARQTGAEARRVLLMRLVSSPEAERLRRDLSTGDLAEAGGLEQGLRSLGADIAFVQRAYECLLGRPADQGGLTHYATALTSGDTRRSVLRSLACSDEFAERYHNLAPQNGLVPRDVQLCELANPAKWDNPEWVESLSSLGLATDKLSMHRKPYEFAQLIFGCRRLGALRPDSSVVSIGAGHELVLYWLANHVGQVVATDMYEGVWQDVQGREGDPDVLENPDDYAPFPYRRDRLRFMKMDGRHLTFPDGSFDVAYSLSSIEHFGGVEGAAATIREMGRVLKPGGILALATEYVLKGPPHDETFQPDEFMGLIRQTGLELVESIDTEVYKRYSYTPIDLYKNPYQSPHMVVRFNDTVFTTVFVFLRRVARYT
jgi:SAM-dependent methyltransferase